MSTLNLKKEKYDSLDRVYSGDKNDLSKLKKPNFKKNNSGLLKKVFLAFVFIIFIIALYFVFINYKNKQKNLSENWYSVKLINGEIYFAQVADLNSDPMEIINVYYNYDQQKGENIENQSLRLVKRGQETYGPTGTMHIIRSQILYLEPLKNDSKVLNAILNYER